MLEGKKLLITGVLTPASIGYAVAERAIDQGAEVVLSGFGRGMRITQRVARRLPGEPDVLELDVNDGEQIEAVRAALDERWGELDGVLHAIAFAPPEALGGNFMQATPEQATIAFQTSAYSLKALAGGLADLLERSGSGSVVGLDFDATVAWPVYDWMGVAKAALESVSRYVARDLGPRGVRCNLVSAGPLSTTAARGISGFSQLSEIWQTGAPLGWDPKDSGPVADATIFLLSDGSRGISGEILHVDGGFHAMGAPIREAGAAAEESAEPAPEDEPEADGS